MADAAAHADGVRALVRALGQAAEVLDSVRSEDLDKPTPCEDWNVSELLDHLIATPGQFLASLRGEKVDWAAPLPHIEDSWGAVFRRDADALARAWNELEGEPPSPPEWQITEFAVHTWDLATAIGWPVGSLDPEVAEIGMAFMQRSLGEENRVPFFGPEQVAPEGSSAYDQLAAFSGRNVL